MKSNPPLLMLHQQLFRFGVVGLTAAILHFCSVVLCVQYLFLDPLIANIFAFMIAFQVSYWGHHRWTFARSESLHAVALPKLLLVQTTMLILSEILFYIFLAMHLPYPIALLIVLTILPMFTFTLNKFWVFK